jgi:cell division protein FtsI (penicillin-binding protein 3)
MIKDKEKIWKRVYLIYFSILLLALFIIIKIVYIQVADGEEMMAKAKEQSLQYITIDATRGNIYSIDGSLIATSVPVFEIRLDLDSSTVSSELFDKDIDSLSYCLADFFKDKTKDEYKSILINEREKQNRYYLLKKELSYLELKQLEKFPIFREGRYKGGFIVIEKERRQMPFKLLAKRTIGYERNGLFVGLEGAYSKELLGSSGKRLVQKIANGVWMPVNDNNEIAPQHGNDIVSTIDINIQDVAETALYEHLEYHQADHGCAILMEVHTGEIRAIANLAKLKDGSYGEIYNWAVGESTEPGSTFKLASLMALFEDGLADLDDLINTGDGTYDYYDQTMEDTHEGGYGTITVQEAFEKSSNIGISKLIYNAYKDNKQDFIKRLKQMHLHEKLGIEIAGEGKAFIKDTSHPLWSNVSLPWMAIGYELSLTPLQILSFYNAVANDGKLLRPMFVKEIRQAGKTIKTIEPYVIDEAICSESTIQKAKILLEGVVKNGTAKSIFKDSPYMVAGKTATAQIATKDGYNKENYQASFVGYFPADNPQYSCIVVVNNPQRGDYYGGAVAAPVFREIADKVCATHSDIEIENMHFNNVQYPSSELAYYPDLQTVYRQLGMSNKQNINNKSLWASSNIKRKEAVYTTQKITTEILADVRGMTAKDACFLLEKSSCIVKIVGRGKVYKQSIAPGTKIRKGTDITIFLKV